jgi:hypothetical protein
VSLSRTAASIAARLNDSSRRRIGVDQVRDLLFELEPHVAHSPAKRWRLHEILDELVEGTVVSLPRGRDQYDRVEQPVLPRFVIVQARATRPHERRAMPAATYPWPPELRWAAHLRPPVRPDEMDVLRTVSAFLLRGGDRPLVPVQERSLELFGDEKRLAELSRQRLFAPGRLSLAMLRCREVHPPFVFRKLSDRPTLLVVENSATYDTMLRVLDGTGPVGTVAYGAGKHFVLSVAAACDLDPVPSRILYFGDLDADGLLIPARASETAAAHGLPPVEPAAALYRLLLAVAPGAAGTAPVAADRHVAWLPEALRGPAQAVLGRSQRLAQEHVGLERLRAAPDWLDELRRQLATAPAPPAPSRTAAR